MIIERLTKTIVADQSVVRFCQAVCSVIAGLVLVLGIRRLSELELTESQLFSTMTATLALAGVFVILAFQWRAWRRSG